MGIYWQKSILKTIIRENNTDFFAAPKLCSRHLQEVHRGTSLSISRRWKTYWEDTEADGQMKGRLSEWEWMIWQGPAWWNPWQFLGQHWTGKSSSALREYISEINISGKYLDLFNAITYKLDGLPGEMKRVQ